MILCIGPTPALQRVMVFKDLTLDLVNRAVETVDGIAGKSINVAKVLKALGEDPIALGFVGGLRGEHLSRQLETRRIRSDFIHVRPETRECVTVINQRQGTQTELVEESKPVPAKNYRALLSQVKRYIDQSAAMVISGTLTPGAPEDFYFECARVARREGAIVVLDVKGPALMKALEAEPDVVKPNLSELEATAGKRLNSARGLMQAIRDLCEHGAKNVAATAGARPAMAFDGRTFWRIISPRIEALNPIGSGDAFTAGVAARLVKGDSFREACRWGAACGAANALTIMAGEVDPKTVKRLVSRVKIERMS